MPQARTAAVVGILLAVITTGCGTGGPPATAPPSSPPGPASPTLRAEPGVTATPTAVVARTGPPVAMLAGVAAGAGIGALGSSTWDGSGTDAPWIVPPDGSRAAAGDRLDVAFDPAAEPASWTARWAPVTASGAGDVAGGVDGSGPVTIAAPGEPGDWSLQLEASFGQGRSGTWYWRLEVVP